jgi:hypothetical protein
MEVPRQYLPVQSKPLCFEQDARSGFELLSGVHQRTPSGDRRWVGLVPCSVAGVPLNPLEQQTLDRSAARLAPTQQTSREYSGIVQYEEVARAQVPIEFTESRVLEASALAVQNQEARISPNRRRRLCNQLIRKSEVEIGYIHLSRACGGASTSDSVTPPVRTDRRVLIPRSNCLW